jgi:hypothetical protein
LKRALGLAEPSLSDRDLGKRPVSVRHRELEAELVRGGEELA